MEHFNTLFGLVALGVGLVVGYILRQNFAKKQLNTAEAQAARLLEKAEKEVQTLTLDAKNQALQILEEAKKEENKRLEKLHSQEDRLEKREVSLRSRIKHNAEKRKLLESRAN